MHTTVFTIYLPINKKWYKSPTKYSNLFGLLLLMSVFLRIDFVVKRVFGKLNLIQCRLYWFSVSNFFFIIIFSRSKRPSRYLKQNTTSVFDLIPEKVFEVISNVTIGI